MSGLTQAQVAQLLKPINERRVGRRDGMSHLEAYDVRAHLIRCFGFGGWSGEVLDMAMLYETPTQTKAGKPAYAVAYRCTYRLTIHATGAAYTETATGDALMPDFKRGDAHDFAIKTAESQAFKRCAINLGDQFGLSLYQQGSTAPLVGRTLTTDDEPTAPVDDHVEQVAPETPAPQADTPPPSLDGVDTPAGQDWADTIRDRILAGPPDGQKVKAWFNHQKVQAGLHKVLGAIVALPDGEACTLEKLIDTRMREAVAA